jgi:hypothetical protein
MWILFLIILTSPGQYQVQVLETYKTPQAEVECKETVQSLFTEFSKTYQTKNETQSYSFICLREKDLET